MLRSNDIYIDLGTSNTLIYKKGHGFFVNEPSVVATKYRKPTTADVLGFGQRAKLMLGKTPENINVSRPLKEGVIADFENTSRMLWAFLNQVKQNSFWFRPRMIISLPCEVTEFEKKAVVDVGLSLGASSVYLLDEPMAAAIGANIPILQSRAHMIVDIGGGTTEIAVISLGGIISSKAVRIGGNTIDQAIADLLHSKHRFYIGEQSAERIKLDVAQALVERNLVGSVGGINLTTGLPQRIVVDSRMLLPAVDLVVSQIAQSIKEILSEIDPEVSSDLMETGITLAGGGALIKNLDKCLHQNLKIPVRVAPSPLLSVSMGGAKALDSDKLFDAIEKPA